METLLHTVRLVADVARLANVTLDLENARVRLMRA